MTTYIFPRRMQSTRWMDEKVVTSEKCWNGTEEKMPEISKEFDGGEKLKNLKNKLEHRDG